MSVTTGPFTVTAGKLTPIKVPDNAPYAAVVLQNATALNLIVNEGSSGPAWLAQFQANLFLVAASNAPIILDATANAASVAGGPVLATWYDPAELAAGIGGTYPMTLFGSAISAAISGAVSTQTASKLLFNANTTATTAGNVVGPIAAPAPFACVEVYLGGPAGSPCGAVLVNTTTGAFSGAQSLTFGSSPAPLFFPVPFNIGDNLQLTLYCQNPPGVFTVACIIIGLGELAQPTILRPDGRLPPVGYQPASNAGSPGAGVPLALIAAPTGGFSLMLKHLTLAIGAGGASGEVTIDAHLNGGATSLGTLVSPTSVATEPAPLVLEWESGLVLDANTAVTITPSQNIFVAGAGSFDIVK